MVLQRKPGGLVAGKKEKGMEEQEAWYLLGHHLLDLWFHVAVHCFGFKTNKQRERDSSVRDISLLLCNCDITLLHSCQRKRQGCLQSGGV